MRKFLLALIACLVAVIAYATPGSPYLSYGWRASSISYGTVAYVQSAKSGNCYSGTTCTTTSLTSTPSSGNLAVAIVGCSTGFCPTSNVTDNFGDSGGTSWAQYTGSPWDTAIPSSVGTHHIYVYYRTIGTGATCGAACTATYTNATQVYGGINYVEVSKTSGSWHQEVTATTATGNSTTLDPGAITTSSTSSFVFGWSVNAGTATVTPGTGYTSPATLAHGWDTPQAYDDGEYKVTTSSGSYDPTYTIGAAASWWALAISFDAY